jgi:hypothetical protein
MDTWDTGNVYSGSGRIEAEAYDADLVEYILEGDVQVCPATDDPTTWVVELAASVIVEVYLSVSFCVWDSIDLKEVPLGSQSERVRKTIEVDAFLTCSDVHLEGQPDDWHIEIEIGLGPADSSWRSTSVATEVHADWCAGARGGQGRPPRSFGFLRTVGGRGPRVPPACFEGRR